ncbi:Putative amine oxidase, FAD/NAD(P)-binding domain superfamily [Colletotrichum destructivum]|uniref:Amine oxidase, FAD/NAD(P)-binding domain superfamily n=1 Tax=Colletotrichum destructivum TaxID=34406 RepID=A0AAX4IJQ3_9PEZI|nr:Putative amine oxidase, FAD/NAD(P)-binding domain superfamily [Colletotrichum destructivum]
MSREAPIRVALVGTGLAGLTTAYLLQNDEQRRYAVTLFEQAESLSFDSASVAIRDERSGHVERVDLPMRALAGGYYANVMRMYDHLGIPYHPIRFLFSFAKALPARSPEATAAGKTPANPEGAGRAPGEYFVHASNLHQIPPWPGSRGVLAHLIEILYLIVCQFWFTVACFLVRPHTEWADGGGETLDEYFRRIWLPRRYVTHYLLPLMSSVSTCSHDEMLAFPASDVVNYKRLTHGQQHYTVCGGVHQVEGRLAAEMKDVRLGACVAEVAPTSDGKVRIRWQSTSSGLEPLLEDVFDRVILAVSPDVAGRIFSPLRETLGSIPTTRVESSVLRPSNSTPSQQPLTLVEDESSHPKACSHHRGSAIPPQVICLRTDFTAEEVRTEALHKMPGGTVVSTCPLDPQADAKRVLRTARFTRTLRTTESRAAIRRIMGEARRSDKKTDPVQGAENWVNGQDNVWLTGAWCWDGMVLLEGCLVSAMRIANDFGVKVPWTR